jgi:hypothetical protein
MSEKDKSDQAAVDYNRRLAAMGAIEFAWWYMVFAGLFWTVQISLTLLGFLTPVDIAMEKAIYALVFWFFLSVISVFAAVRQRRRRIAFSANSDNARK